MKREITEINGCIDCIMYLANGELPEGDDNQWPGPAEIARIWDGYHVVVAGGEDTEAHFSWSECDVCRSQLGGDRYPCAAWKCEAA
jgi:hypothetical protein